MPWPAAGRTKQRASESRDNRIEHEEQRQLKGGGSPLRKRRAKLFSVKKKTFKVETALFGQNIAFARSVVNHRKIKIDRIN